MAKLAFSPPPFRLPATTRSLCEAGTRSDRGGVQGPTQNTWRGRGPCARHLTRYCRGRLHQLLGLISHGYRAELTDITDVTAAHHATSSRRICPSTGRRRRLWMGPLYRSRTGEADERAFGRLSSYGQRDGSQVPAPTTFYSARLDPAQQRPAWALYRAALIVFRNGHRSANPRALRCARSASSAFAELSVGAAAAAYGVAAWLLALFTG